VCLRDECHVLCVIAIGAAAADGIAERAAQSCWCCRHSSEWGVGGMTMCTLTQTDTNTYTRDRQWSVAPDDTRIAPSQKEGGLGRAWASEPRPEPAPGACVCARACV
jgi:hypothetical protein